MAVIGEPHRRAQGRCHPTAAPATVMVRGVHPGCWALTAIGGMMSSSQPEVPKWLFASRWELGSRWRWPGWRCWLRSCWRGRRPRCRSKRCGCSPICYGCCAGWPPTARCPRGPGLPVAAARLPGGADRPGAGLRARARLCRRRDHGRLGVALGGPAGGSRAGPSPLAGQSRWAGRGVAALWPASHPGDVAVPWQGAFHARAGTRRHGLPPQAARTKGPPRSRPRRSIAQSHHSPEGANHVLRHSGRATLKRSGRTTARRA